MKARLPALLGGVLLVTCCPGRAAGLSPAAQSRALEVPLATTIVPGPSLQGASASGGSAWAIVPMGGFGNPAGVSWQLFVLGGARPSWGRVTPPGVADNGGLIGSFLSTGGVVGVEPSGRLGYSPVASTDTRGAHWSPGALPGPLTPVPDALAAASGGRLLALLGASGSSIVESDDDASGATATVSSRAAVAAVGEQACDLTALTAVAFGPGGRPMTAGRCENSYAVGIFARLGNTWELVGPPVPAAILSEGATSPAAVSALTGPGLLETALEQPVVTEVLWLSVEGSRLTALVEAVSSDGTASVFRLTRSAAGAWASSALYDLAPSQQLIATGDEPDGSCFVLVSASGSREAEVLGPSGLRWRALPPLPAGTETLALEAGGVPEALAVSGSTLNVFALGRTGVWTRVQ